METKAMKKSTRILLGLFGIEAVIIGGGLFLLNAVSGKPSASGYPEGETSARIWEMMGLFAGGIGAVMLLLFFLQRSKERKAGE
jgi:hypothetical protein